MKILFLPTNNKGVTFWRMGQFWAKMKEKGIDAFIFGAEVNDSTTMSWEHEFAQKQNNIRNQIYGLLNHCDICVLQSIHNDVILAIIKMYQCEFNKKFLAENDDLILDVPDYNPGFQGGYTPGNYLERIKAEHFNISDGLIVSTDFLKKQYKKYNKQIDVVPNCINFKAWDFKPKTQGKKVRIGWAGGGNHSEDLRIMMDVMPALIKKYKNIEFVYVHGIPNYLKDLKSSKIKLVKKWVDIGDYPKFLHSQNFDIGIAPLVVNKFNQAKSNLRWLEYSALGIPAVCTYIEPYEKSIMPGETGFLCETVDDWIRNLSFLIENPKARKQVGENAKQAVFENFNLDKETDKYIKVLRGYHEQR